MALHGTGPLLAFDVRVHYLAMATLAGIIEDPESIIEVPEYLD